MSNIQPTATETEPSPLWSDERLIMRSEAIAASWHRVLDREQVYLLRCQILGLLREVYAEVVDHRSTISQLVASFNQLTDEIRQQEAKLAQQAAQLAALRQELAGRQGWTPVNPVGMVNDEYADAEIKLCYRRLTPASQEAAVGAAAQEEE